MKSLLLAAAVSAVCCVPSAFAADVSGQRFAATIGYSAQSLDGDALVPVELNNSYPVGSEVENGDDSGAATLALSWFVTRNLALELWGATASDIDVEIDVENGTDIGVASYRTRPLALSVQYHFTDLFNVGNARITPFLGLGYHHTEVSKVRSNSALSEYDGLEIDSGSGLAATVGLDLAMNDRWFVRGDVRYLSWSSESKTAGQTLAEADMDSMLYGVSVGIRF